MKVGRSKGLVTLSGVTVHPTWDNFITTIFMGPEYICGRIRGFMRGIGDRIACTVKEHLRGQMVEDTSVNTPTTKKKALASSSGRTAVVIVVNGLTVANTARVLIFQVMVKLNMVNGETANEPGGLGEKI